MDDYLEKLEAAVLHMAHNYGGSATPAMHKWYEQHSQVIVEARRRNGNAPGVAGKNLSGKCSVCDGDLWNGQARALVAASEYAVRTRELLREVFTRFAPKETVSGGLCGWCSTYKMQHLDGCIVPRIDAAIAASPKDQGGQARYEISAPADGTAPANYESFGYALAMRVMQDPMYRQLDDRERAECDELIARGMRPGCDSGEGKQLSPIELFAIDMLEQHRNGGYPGDVDGGWMQDKAIEAGLLRYIDVSEPCGDVCPCAETDDFPQQCLVYSPDMFKLAAIARRERAFASGEGIPK